MGNKEELMDISKKIGLPTKKVKDFLWALMEGKVDNTALVGIVGVSKNVLNQIKESLGQRLVPASKNTELSEDGKELVQELFQADYQPEESMWGFLDRQPEFKQVLDFLKLITDKRPKPIRDLDQFTATEQTTARRVALMSFFEDIDGKRVLFLGDDDFTSVGAGLQKKASRITVLDVDSRICDEIFQISSNQNLDIDVDKYDAFQQLPGKYRGQYDVVFTDPPYTVQGIEMFLSRAIDSLDASNSAGRIYLCFGNSDRAKERFIPIMELINSMGLMCRWVFDKFNRYTGADSIGSSSTLFICDVTPKTKSSVKGEYQGKIYTN